MYCGGDAFQIQNKMMMYERPNGASETNCSHFFSQGSVVSERDYESLVMMRMRQASERQKLIEKMKQEDEEESCT